MSRMYLNILQKQFQNVDQFKSLSTSHFTEDNLQQYIEILHDQDQPKKLYQVTMNLNEIQNILNCMENEFLFFFDFLEQNYISENFISININNQDAKIKNETLETQDLISNPIEQNKYQGQQYIQYQTEQNVYETEQNQYDKEFYQQFNPINITKNVDDDEQDQEIIPLKGYKQFQQQQQQQQKSQLYSTDNKKNNNDDRITFALPSKLDFIPKEQNQKAALNNNENLCKGKKGLKVSFEKPPNKQDQSKKEKKKNQKESPSSQIYFGIKFDKFNSHQHLIYSQNYESFSCKNEGVGLVQGTFTLQNDTKINLIFSEYQNKTFYAQIGILQVNKKGEFNGTFKEGMNGRLIYGMDEKGNLFTINQNFAGKLKITLNKEYKIFYSSKTKMIYFIRGETEVNIDSYQGKSGIKKASGNFKFFIKLCGGKVSILN